MDVRGTIGRPVRLVWPAPCYLIDDAELTVHHPLAGDVQPAFASVRSASSVVAIASDRRTLTLGEAIAAPGPVAGEEGDAYLRLPDGGVMPVTVESIDGATLTLADSLHRVPVGVAGDTPATLQWACWVATLTGALTATLQRAVPWTVRALGLGALGDIVVEEPGLLSVVRRPFSTGITVGHLHRARPELAEAVYRRATHADALAAAFDRLVTWLRADLGVGRYEDDVFNGHDFQRVHILLARAELADDPEIAGRLRADARELYRQKSERVLLDLDGDGQADALDKDIGGADESAVAFGGMRRCVGRR